MPLLQEQQTMKAEAQQTNVEEEAKSEKIFAVLSFTVTSYIEII